ncbi:hypothetical protein [Methanorbis furvi]|uniref:Uncharacterized protein n=1 Tax=Methanorbis furvi TaxID=3028299 RepID=A0AAE4MCT7_9EURY|nr:hypothetical protein [Methanocorpusculaceae archaeon Ag1]
MGIFDGLMNFGSSILNTASSFVSTVTAPVRNFFSGTPSGSGSPSGGGGSPGSSGSSGSSGGVGSWVSGVQAAFTEAVNQAAKQVEQITSSLNDTLAGITKGFDDLGKNLDNFGKDITANLPKIFDAETTLKEAQTKLDQLIKAGGDIPANLQKQFDDAKAQVEQKKKEIKVQTDTYAKDIVQKATAAAAAATPVDVMKAALTLNPLTMPFVMTAEAGKNVLSGLGIGNSNVMNPDAVSVNKSDPNLLYNLDYSNPNVQFFSSEVDEQGNKKSTGYLGQFAKPYAVADEALFFNTGGIRGGSNAPAGASSWTDTPDSQKLHDYGLGSNVIYSSRDLDAAEQARVLAMYKEKGWLQPTGGKTVAERAAAAVEKIPVAAGDGKVVYKGVGGGGIGSGLFTAANGKTYDLNNPATALSVVADGIGGAPAVASGFIDQAVAFRNDLYGSGGEAMASGNVAAGIASVGIGLAVDVAAPVDLINVVNLWTTGRGDQIDLEDIGWAVFDAVAVGAGVLTFGTGYLGLKGVKAGLKGLKTASKTMNVVGYGGQAAWGGVTALGAL